MEAITEPEVKEDAGMGQFAEPAVTSAAPAGDAKPEAEPAARIKPKTFRYLLIFGNSCAGKSTLAKELVKQGICKSLVEADDVGAWTIGHKLSWSLVTSGKWTLEEWKAAVRRKMEYVGTFAVASARMSAPVAISGLWNKETGPLFSYVGSDYAVVVVVQPDRSVAKDLWAKRSVNPGPFDEIFPPDKWEKMLEGFRELARTNEAKGKLLLVGDLGLSRGEETSAYDKGKTPFDPAFLQDALTVL